MINRKVLIIGLVLSLVLVIGFMVFEGRSNTAKYVTTGPAYVGEPIANFTGGKSKDFYENVSETNYSASRNIIGDFLINNQKINIKQGTKTTALVEIKSFSDEYGENSQYIINFEFKSLDSGESYKAKIVNYMDDSQSSKLIILDKNYEKTFGNIIN